MYCGSILSVHVLKHPGRSQLVFGLSGGSLRFRDAPAFSAAIYFFRGCLLFRDVSLYLLGETCETWALLGLSITDIKFVLTQKGLDTLCQAFHIPDDVHPQLPSPNQTIHEMPTGKIGVYTRDGPACFIQVADPTKVKVGEREHAEEESRLLDSTVGCVVPLLPVAPTRVDSKLEASVERLFDEGASTDQEDFAGGGGQETEIVMGVRIVANENVVTENPKHPRKKRQAVMDVGGSFHPPKKLRGDHRTSSGATIGDKSSFALKELLASSMLNVEAGVAAVTTLPMVTSSVSATLEHESGVPADSITRLNLRTIGASERFVISLDSSYHSSINASGAEADSIIRSVVVPPVMTEAVTTSHVVNAPAVPESSTKFPTPVHASMFHDSDSTETMKSDIAGPCYFARQDLSLGSRELNSETLRQARLNAEVRMRTEYCLSERKRLESECEKQAGLLKAIDDKVEGLKAQLLLKEAEVVKAARLRAQVSAAEATEKVHAAEIDALKQRNVALENEKASLDGKVTELQSLAATKDLELKDLSVVVSSLRSQNDSLVDQVHVLETTCSGLRDQVSRYERLKEQVEEFQDAQMNIVNDKVAKLDADLLEMALHLEENFYPHLLNTISGRSRAIEKGMQDGLPASIDHGKAGRSLEDVVAYNPAAEVDYTSALQRLREVDFSLLAKLKSHKDASTADVIDLLRLEDQVIVDETSLLVILDVTHSQVERIRENITAQWSYLIGVWTPLVDPLSVENLVGAAYSSNSMPATAATTTTLSTTFASASTVPPITIEDYKIIVEFEKEELDTTPERDPPS
ncbi:hypothetical protein Tco_0766933 [Tanacetum coccineum]